jgi:hypothetical protein
MMIDYLTSGPMMASMPLCSTSPISEERIVDYMALNPPSRLSIQLFAYLFVARKTAAPAISDASPKHFRGMEVRASRRASGVMARCCKLEYSSGASRGHWFISDLGVTNCNL